MQDLLSILYHLAEHDELQAVKLSLKLLNDGCLRTDQLLLLMKLLCQCSNVDVQTNRSSIFLSNDRSLNTELVNEIFQGQQKCVNQL